MVRKALQKVHLVLGLVSGLLVFVLSVTGCLLAFVDELKPIVYKDYYALSAADVGSASPSFTGLMQVAEKHWGAAKPVSAVEITNDALRTWHFRAFQQDDHDGIWYWNEKKYYESLFVNPYTAEAVYSLDEEFEFFRVVLYLHWSLLLKNDIGQPIVGVVTLMFVVLLISGLYLWWPKNKKARRVRFSFQWKKETGIKRKNYDLHNVLGFYSFAIALLLGLTGLVWAFSWFDESLQSVLDKMGSTATKVEQVAPPAVAPQMAVDLPVYDRIYTEVRQLYPDAKGYYFYFPQQENKPLNVFVRYAKQYQSIVRQYDNHDGHLLQTIDFAGKTNGKKMRDLNYDLHLGSILGIAGKTIVFLASLICASMPITGFYIWYNRRNKKKTTRGKAR